jgi:biopolymer transport protein ExbD
MSHGTAVENVDPDLTPMLDVVMQLLMYFIVTVNFVTQEANEDLKLPNSSAARPINAKTRDDVLLLNILAVKEDEAVDFKEQKVKAKFKHGVGKEAMKWDQFRDWLDKRATEARNKSKDNTIHTVLVHRLDQDLTYEDVFEIMTYCRSKGFVDQEMRSNRVEEGHP